MPRKIVVEEDRSPDFGMSVVIGDHEVHGRPVEYNKPVIDFETMTAEDGSKCVAIKYLAACPYCGCSVEFDHNERCTECAECGAGESIQKEKVFVCPFENPGNYE